MNHWRITKWALPLVLVTTAFFLLGKPMLEQATGHREAAQELQRQIDNREAYMQHLDSLRNSVHTLARFQENAKALKTPKVPGLDSLRRLAESMNLSVLDMLQEKNIPTCYQQFYRLDLESNFLNLTAWLDSIAFFEPLLQVERLQWSPGRKTDRISLYFGEIDHAANCFKDSNAQTWLTRAHFSKSGSLAPTDTEVPLKNPFLGNIVERVVVRSAAPAAPTPKQPAPAFQIVGLVGGRMATIQLTGGERKLLRPGDALGDWRVETITANFIVLRNGSESKTYNTK